MTQRLSVLNIIGKNLDLGKETDLIFMAIAKAFDRVDQSVLLCKLRNFGMTGGILDWFRHYLSHPFSAGNCSWLYVLSAANKYQCPSWLWMATGVPSCF
jgi:hypothetical protein